MVRMISEVDIVEEMIRAVYESRSRGCEPQAIVLSADKFSKAKAAARESCVVRDAGSEGFKFMGLPIIKEYSLKPGSVLTAS